MPTKLCTASFFGHSNFRFTNGVCIYMNKQFFILASLLALMSSISIKAMDSDKAKKREREKVQANAIYDFYNACMKNTRQDASFQSFRRADSICHPLLDRLDLYCKYLESERFMKDRLTSAHFLILCSENLQELINKDRTSAASTLALLPLTDKRLKSHVVAQGDYLLFMSWALEVLPKVCCKKDVVSPSGPSKI